MRKKSRNTFLLHTLQLKQTLGQYSTASLMLQQNRKMVGELRREVKTIQMPEAARCSAGEVIPSKATTNITLLVTGDFSLSFCLLKWQLRTTNLLARNTKDGYLKQREKSFRREMNRRNRCDTGVCSLLIKWRFFRVTTEITETWSRTPCQAFKHEK